MKMNKFALSAIFMILAISGESLASVAPILSLMPDSIKTIKSPIALEPYLTSDKVLYRIWAVYRLGQIGTSADIPRLADLYQNEPFRPGGYGLDGMGPGVKYMALEAIGNIDGPIAKSTLLAISQNYGHVGAEDSLYSLIAICRALGNFNSRACARELGKILRDEKMGSIERIESLGSLYRIEIKDSRHRNASDTINYFINIIRGFSKETNQSSYERLIPDAVRSAIIRIANPSLLEAFDKRYVILKHERKMTEYLSDMRDDILFGIRQKQEQENLFPDYQR